MKSIVSHISQDVEKSHTLQLYMIPDNTEIYIKRDKIDQNTEIKSTKSNR